MRKKDAPVTLHPLTFEEALTRLVKTTPSHDEYRSATNGSKCLRNWIIHFAFVK